MNFNKIRFRNANMNDIESIMTIEHSSFSKEICETENVFTERIRIFPEGFRIMEYDEEVIGYICSEIWNHIYEIKSESFKLGHPIGRLHNPEGTEVYVSSMGLLPAYRGKGLGKLMFNNYIKYINDVFPNIEFVILIVSEKWTSAIRIYESNGYKKIKTIKNFFIYEEKKKYYEDGIVMRKELG